MTERNDTTLAKGTIEFYTCPVCGSRVTQLRRGRCVSCYQKWVETQPVPVGATCVVCGERRRDNLQRVELFGRWWYMCHICAYKAVRLDPMPPHIEGVKARLQRNRRLGDRRIGMPDNRSVKRERRVGERRATGISEDFLWLEEEVIYGWDQPIEGEITAVYERIDEASILDDDDGDFDFLSADGDRTVIEHVESIDDLEEVLEAEEPRVQEDDD